MRIAYVINSVEGGGAAAPVPAVAGVLMRQGAAIEIFALTRRNGRALAAMEAAGLTVHVRPGGERDHLAAAAWLDGRIRDFGAQLIWTSLTRATLLGQMVGARRGLPVVSWQHNAYLKPANALLLRASQRLSALWVGDSLSVTALTARRLGAPSERLAAWPLFAARPDAPQARPWEPGETLRLGSLGRLHPAKGYDLLVQALAILRAEGFRAPVPFEIRIAGEGAERGALEAAMAHAGIDNMRLQGFADNPRGVLQDLHLYLQPSRREGLCIAVHEAMETGLPALVTAVGEMPFSVASGVTGLVVPPGDPRPLAQALRALLSEPGDLTAMGEAARARVLQRFSTEAFDRAGAQAFTRAASAVRAARR